MGLLHRECVKNEKKRKHRNGIPTTKRQFKIRLFLEECRGFQAAHAACERKRQQESQERTRDES